MKGIELKINLLEHEIENLHHIKDIGNIKYELSKDLYNNQINESINKIKAAHKYEEKKAFFYYSQSQAPVDPIPRQESCF